jgi:uncharacterized membrane protein
MTSFLLDWASLLLRWTHIMVGIMWIGTSFYFIWLDSSLRKRAGRDERIAGESWQVHGGGFYQVEKYTVAPDTMPEELHWFKYEAYFTWLTGFGLMAIIYYWGAEAFLINPNVMPLTPLQAIGLSVGSLFAGWVFYDLLCRSPIGKNTALLALGLFVLIAAATICYTQFFSGRAAFLHVGALIGTIMAANVFFIIIPNQKKTVAALMEGRTPDPSYGAQAKQRSLHNNYLTLPVLFMMISNHYPIVFGHDLSWAIALGIIVAGGMIRHFFNQHESGTLNWTGQVALPLGGLAIVALIFVTGSRLTMGSSEATVDFADVQRVIGLRCQSCHAETPLDLAFEEPPAGVVFDTPQDIARFADQIVAQAVLTDTMPLGNMTEMTDEERGLLGAWVAQGANID